MKRTKTEEFSSHRYGFPHPPYQIQTDFAEKMHSLLDDGGLGIFESPTGTGKTLSILCSALSWLEEKQVAMLSRQCDAAKDAETGSSKSLTGPSWVYETLKRQQLTEIHDWLSLQQEKVNHVKQRAEEYKSTYHSALPLHTSLQRQISIPTHPKAISGKAFKRDGHCALPIGSASNQRILNVDEPTKSDIEGLLHSSKFHKIQIIICSRTHSQLSQYVDEIRKTKYSASVRMVCLGSRQQLCVNQEAKKAAVQSNYLNDICRKLTEKGKCKFKKNAFITTDLALSEPLQIEEIVRYGSHVSLASCPYFGAREAAKEADIILVPYSCILHAETMDNLELRIEHNILIFDEAHNIINAISAARSCVLTKQQITFCREDVEAYLKRYKEKLGSHNAFLSEQLQRFCHLLEIGFKNHRKEEACKLSNYLVLWHLDAFDLHQLNNWLLNSGICQKLRGFSESYRKINILQAAGSAEGNETSLLGDASYNAIFNVHQLISSLLSCDSNDRLLIYPENASLEEVKIHDAKIKQPPARIEVLSLSAESRFKQIVEKAHAVMLVGGTMEPKREFLPLYSFLPPGKLKFFTSSHIVPPENIFACAISSGNNGFPLDFRYQSRDNKSTLLQLGEIIEQITLLVPGGCVIFFPSFQYLDHFCRFLDETDVENKLKTRISRCKRLFIETRANAKSQGGNENLLRSYITHVKNSNMGGVLFSVVSGRLSEGINFSDNLARCVMVIGIPYPNEDLKLSERMKYYDRKFQFDGSATNSLNEESNLFSNKENLCQATSNDFLSGKELKTILSMKAVNQCIGRAIRHKDDFAAILLIDHRYNESSITCLLPKWVQKSLKSFKNITKCDSADGKEPILSDEFSCIKNALTEFFDGMKAF